MFQSFEVTSTPQFGKRSRQRASGSLRRARTSTASSFPVPTSSRANMCRHRPSACRGSPASPDRPASRSSRRARRSSSSMAATSPSLRNRSTARSLPAAISSANRRMSGSRATERRASGSASIRGCIPAPRSASWKRRLRRSGGTLVFLDHNPLDRLWTDRPAEPLGRVTIQTVDACRRAGQGQDRDDGSRDCQGRVPTPSVLTDPVFDRLDLQHPRRRRAAYAASARPRHHPCRRQGRTVPRQAQDRHRGGSLPRPDGEPCAPSSFEDAACSRLPQTAQDDHDRSRHAPLCARRNHPRRAAATVVEAIDPATPAPRPQECRRDRRLGPRASAGRRRHGRVSLPGSTSTQPGTVTEIAAVKKLEACRAGVGQRMQNPLKDISFDTISGAGEHAAIMHYRVTTETDRAIAAGEHVPDRFRAANISTARRTSPAPSRSAPCRKSRSASSRWC